MQNDKVNENFTNFISDNENISNYKSDETLRNFLARTDDEKEIFPDLFSNPKSKPSFCYSPKKKLKQSHVDVEKIQRINAVFEQAVSIDACAQINKMHEFMINYDSSSETELDKDYVYEASSDEEEDMDKLKFEEFMRKVNLEADPDLYPNSQIKFKHFVAICVRVFELIHISSRGKDLLVLLLRACLPRESYLENITTYKKFTKIFDFSDVTEKKICPNCSETLAQKEDCLEQECQAILELSENVNKGPTHIVEIDCKRDLKTILELNWDEMIAYKEVLGKNLISDICNSTSYLAKDLALNSVSLVLFIDGAPFSDAHNGSIWGIFGFIANFPPRLRARFSNILKIYFINGRIFSFNGIYEKQMYKFKIMLQKGIKVKLSDNKKNKDQCIRSCFYF
jgi:hypothetical protein